MAKFDIGGAASGAMTGGSLGGPVGAVAGGLVGGLFSGKKKKKKKVSTLDKKQQQLNDEQYQALRGEGPLADLYNYDPVAANKVFDENIAKYAYRDLNEKGIPGVTGQFRSQGLMNSSYAGDAISKLVRDVQESLNAKRGDYLYNEQKAARNAKQQAVENLQNRQTFAYDTSQGRDPFSGISGRDFAGTADTATDWISKLIPSSALGPVA